MGNNGLLKLLLYSGRANKIAFYDEYGTYTYKEFAKEIGFIEQRLKDVGFNKKANILVHIENRMLAIAALMAVLKCDLVAIPVSVSMPNTMLNDMIKQSDASGKISTNKYGEIVIEKFDVEKNFNNIGTSMMLLTSGSSGSNKLVELSENAIGSIVESVMDYMNINTDDCFFIVKDYVHCSSLISEIFIALASGSSICIYNPREPFSLLRKKIRKHAPTIMGVNPWILEMLCQQKRFVDSYKSIRLMISSGAVLPKSVRDDIGRLLPTVSLINVYGLTEACSRICAQTPFQYNDSYSVGKPVKNVEIKIAADNEEILVHSPGNMLGYYNDKKNTESRFFDGWLHTGDTGYFDENNNLVVLGRIDDVIVTASNKVNPLTVTNIIKQFPNVVDAHTIGVIDKTFGEIVVSFVRYNGQKSSDLKSKIINHCLQYLYSYECPKVIVFVDEIPRTFSGKVKKEELLYLLK